MPSHNLRHPEAARSAVSKDASPDCSARRVAIVTEAETWLGTPFHHQGRVKGAGVDCAMLLAEVYHRCGFVPHIDPGHYPPDWHLHRDAERYLEKVMPYAHEIAGLPKP